MDSMPSNKIVKKGSKSSSSSPSVSDRYIRDRQMVSAENKKISGKGNVMARMKIFNHQIKAQQHISKSLTTHQIVSRTHNEAWRLNMQPRREFQIQSSFEIKHSPQQPLSQLLDWGSDHIVAIAAKQGIQISNLENYYKFHRINYGGQIRCVKFHHQGLVTAFGDKVGILSIFDMDRECLLRKITPNQGGHSLISSVLWNKNMVITASNGYITAEDVGMKKSQIFKVKKHPNVEITSISLYSNKLAIGHENGFISILDLATQNFIQQKNLGQRGYNFVQWCPWKLNRIACGINKSLCMIGGNQLSTQQFSISKSIITGLVSIPSSKEIAVSYGYPNNCVEIKTSELETVKELGSQRSQIINLVLNPKQNLISAVDVDRQGYSWKLNETFHFKKSKNQKKSLNLKIR